MRKRRTQASKQFPTTSLLADEIVRAIAERKCKHGGEADAKARRNESNHHLALVSLLAARLDLVGQSQEKLGETALGGCVVAEDGAEGRVAEGLRETLPQGLAGAGVVAETT